MTKHDDAERMAGSNSLSFYSPQSRLAGRPISGQSSVV